MAGIPSTGRPTGDHCPSPGIAVLENGVMAAGGGRWAGPVATLRGRTVTFLIAPAGGLPPTGGLWWLYQTFSTQFTTLAPPFWRAHSAKRDATDVPRDGSVSAVPSEIPSHTSSPASSTATVCKMRRRRF